MTNRSKALGLAAAILLLCDLSPAIAVAQSVTVCQGTKSCTVVQGSQSRLMTPDELKRKNQFDALAAIWSVPCETASDQATCHNLKRELQMLFDR